MNLGSLLHVCTGVLHVHMRVFVSCMRNVYIKIIARKTEGVQPWYIDNGDRGYMYSRYLLNSHSPQTPDTFCAD